LYLASINDYTIDDEGMNKKIMAKIGEEYKLSEDEIGMFDDNTPIALLALYIIENSPIYTVKKQKEMWRNHLPPMWGDALPCGDPNCPFCMPHTHSALMELHRSSAMELVQINREGKLGGAPITTSGNCIKNGKLVDTIPKGIRYEKSKGEENES
jgi:hypothetical protein